jgi:hypothetical protein
MTEPIEGAELVESPTLRSRHLDRTDVLDKVGELSTLPEAAVSTIEQAAEFYKVPANTIRSVVEDNRAELEGNGYRTLTGAELKPFKGSSYVGLRARSLAVFSRTAVLNVGMLLTGSDTARAVRRYLLTVEATATVEHKATAVELVRIQERMDYRNILNALKRGGAESEDYQFIQNSIYTGLFGKTAAQIRRTQPQVSGTPLKRGPGFRKSSVAKDYLTPEQLTLLDNVVLASTAQLNANYPKGATVAQMLDVIHASIRLLKPRALSGDAA